jgi:hypothetical protein
VSSLGDLVGQALDAGQPPLGDGPAVALLLAELPSGARIGIGRDGSFWIAPDGGEPVGFVAGTEGRFVEVLEVSRRDFDDRLEAGARAAGLPVDAVLVAFPAVPLVRAILAMSSGYTARLALRWFLPSERAELLPVIAPLARNADMPQDVRDLARHLAG